MAAIDDSVIAPIMTTATSSTSTDSLVQSFRSSLEGPVTEIEALWDPKLNCHIILWSRIQSAFENPRSVQLNKKQVSFLVNEDFQEVLPLRIAYHPGIVLEVIERPESMSTRVSSLSIPDPVSSLSISDPVSSLSIPDPVSSLSIPDPVGIRTDAPLSSRVDTTSTVTSPATSTSLSDPSSPPPNSDAVIPGPDTVVGRLVRLAARRQNSTASVTSNSSKSLIQNLTTTTKSSIQSSAQLYESFLQSMKNGQMEQAESLKTEFRQHFSILQGELGENRDLQQEMKQMMSTMLEMQRQANERLIAIQNGIRAILTQTYELLEYPIPRLFIVLPKESSRLDILNPFTDKYRLFFLCECGEHTKSEHNKIPNHIHMAKHEGYDLDRPTEFFSKYGPYVLNMLRMLKHGVSVAGFIVPPLAHLKLADGLDQLQKGLESIGNNLEPHVDTAILYLEKLQSDFDLSPEEGGADKIDKAEALEGAELRQVANFLKNRDQAKVLGNLYRVTTSEGHVKWVCLDHYRDNYSAVAIKAFVENVKLNQGQYDEYTGTLKMTLKSSSLAKEFYGLLIKARNIQELDLTLAWDMTYGDLKLLRDTLQAVNVAKISIDCGHFTGPATDAFNRGKRCDPLVHIAMNTKLLSASFTNVNGFFTRSTTFPKKPTPLRELHIDSIFSPKSHGKNLVILLEQSMLLTTMTLSTSDEEFYETLDLVRNNTMNHRMFQTLQVSSPMFKIQLDSATLHDSKRTPPGTDFRTAVLTTYGPHLQRVVIDDGFTDQHAQLLLAALQISPPTGQLQLLRVDIGHAAMTSAKLSSLGVPKLKTLLQQHLPEGCRVEFECDYGLKDSLDRMPWIFHLSTAVKVKVYNTSELEAVQGAAGTPPASVPSVTTTMEGDQSPKSRLQSLTVVNGDWSWDLTKMKRLVNILSLSPELTQFSFDVDTVPDTTSLTTLVAGIDFSKMKVLTFSILSVSDRYLRAYRTIVDSIPIASDKETEPMAEVVLETLKLQSSSWGYTDKEQKDYYVQEMKKRNPKCTVMFTNESK
ncbi:hypothetical protein BGZ83_008349 [Gryganskiella cystojenkinii]|nr:hypothetical protein BGZ83_008349 [Gryganskiella cystojenkinii]